MKTANAIVPTTPAPVEMEIHPIDRRDFFTKRRQAQQAQDKAKMLELKKAQNEMLKDANALKREQLALLQKQNEMLAALIAAITTERNQK
ncbi:hypothetical protein [Azotobacter chroococcum]|uniref:hypothetical protein n=1 Tax=Azotobacter chroococcum TaxID=353 RepID=UPI0010ADCB9F|nr:hypothetical protein [Azotobacter chroococcum]TKD39919.1 hypothetical protein FCG41_11845 [Azotobacter chroococcum]